MRPGATRLKMLVVGPGRPVDRRRLRLPSVALTGLTFLGREPKDSASTHQAQQIRATRELQTSDISVTIPLPLFAMLSLCHGSAGHETVGWRTDWRRDRQRPCRMGGERRPFSTEAQGRRWNDHASLPQKCRRALTLHKIQPCADCSMREISHRSEDKAQKEAGTI